MLLLKYKCNDIYFEVEIILDMNYHRGKCIHSPAGASILLNQLYTGELIHYCILDESICHFRDVESIVSLLFYF